MTTTDRTVEREAVITKEMRLSDAMRLHGAGPSDVAKTGRFARAYVSNLFNANVPLSHEAVPNLMLAILEAGGPGALFEFCRITGLLVPDAIVEDLLAVMSEWTETPLTPKAVDRLLEVPEWDGHSPWVHEHQIPLTVSVPEFAKGVGISEQRVREMGHAGEIPVISVSERRNRIPKWFVLRFLGVTGDAETPADPDGWAGASSPMTEDVGFSRAGW